MLAIKRNVLILIGVISRLAREVALLHKFTSDLKILLFIIVSVFFAFISFSQVLAKEEVVRIGFFSDIHFDLPKRKNTKYGGVGVDRLRLSYFSKEVNYEIPTQAKSTIESIQPDFLFDSGDMTAHSGDGEFKAYRNWKKTIDPPIYPVIGNHDREHNSPLLPYGTGFYSICGYNSATRVLKLGNLIFILVSEDHHYELNALDAAISTQKFRWIKSQLEKYSKGDNNIFIIEHYPIENTVAWSDYYYGIGGFYLFGSPGWFDWWWSPWKRVSRKWKQLLEKYEEHIVAHISGHLHIPYGWKDIPKDREIYDYGDGTHKIENVGQFVSGEKINNSDRDYPPHHLPEVYFLNIRALDYQHQIANEFEPKSAVYYADLTQGKKSFNLKAVDIITGNELGAYKVNTDYPIDIEVKQKKPHLVSSDLGIRSKEETVEITERNWFKVKKGEFGWVTFQKAWGEKVNITGVNVISKNGQRGRIHFKSSSDGGRTWSSWTTQLPQEANVLQLRTCFWADEKRAMKIRDVKIRTDQLGGEK